MNGLQIINRGLRETNTNSVDYTSATEDLNLVYQEVVDKIVSSTQADYFWDTGRAMTVVNQSEYVAEKLGISPDDLDIKKINKVFIRYTEEQEFPTKARYVTPTSLEYHPDYYKKNQSTNDPFYYIQDNSVFIYPAPQISIGSEEPGYTGKQGFEIFVIHSPADIDDTSTEAEIEVPKEYHRVIAEGLKVYIYYSQGKLNEAQVQQQIYDRKLNEMSKQLKARYNGVIPNVINNLDEYR